MLLSSTEENYIKTIYSLWLKLNGKAVKTNDVAYELDIAASSVTVMLKKLADKKLLIYEKYQGVQLTETGKSKAIQLVRKHRLWEVFLLESLKFSWEEVHEIAEHLEHIRSEKLIDKLDDFLGNPRFDPHGDPIPDKAGNIIQEERVLLSYLKPGEKGTIVGVEDNSIEFLQYLNQLEIRLGAQIKVTHLFSFDKSFIIEDERHRQLNLSFEVAKNIFIKRMA